MSISEDLDYILEKHGKPVTAAPMPEASLAALGDRVPEFLRVFWARFGQCSWFGGGFQVVDPLRYAPVVKSLLAGDPELGPEAMMVYALGPFGLLECWHDVHGDVTLATLPNWGIANRLFKPRTTAADITIGTAFVHADDNASDRADLGGKMMFDRLKKAHGPLAQDHVFAPRLHPAFGGALDVKNFRPVPAPAAITLMYQAEPCLLVDATTPAMRRVRMVGRQG